MSKLWYTAPAKNWNEALPIGNGRLGGMVFADPDNDKIVLNEETLWTGRPEEKKIEHSKERLDEIRTLIKEKRFKESDKAISDMMIGRVSQMYLTLGTLNIKIDKPEVSMVRGEIAPQRMISYKRELDLDNAVITSKALYEEEKKEEKVEYIREYFTSLKDDVMVVSIRAKNKLFDASVILDLNLEGKVTYLYDTISAEGRCPTNYDYTRDDNSFEMEDDKESVPYSLKIKVLCDGHVMGIGKSLKVTKASYIEIIYSVATGFNGFDKQPISEGKDYKKDCEERLSNALKYTFDELKKRHIERYRLQNDRMQLEIDGEKFDDLPTDERIENVKQGVIDNDLTKILFDYGKYLMISCSQEGGQPANLQGIWTNGILSPWNSSYTININTQMNYWAVEQMNLSECHMPLIEMLRDLSKTGNHFGLKGWSCSHCSDLWRMNIECTKTVCCGFWHMGGVWLSRHIYEHYMFTKDKKFLEDNIDILEGVYDFLEGFTVRDDDGKITTCPSTSPENSFLYNDKKASAAEGSAMDLSIIKDYLGNMIELLGVLGRDSKKYEEMLKDLKPLKIGKDGRILEYGEEFEEAEPGHRHISHLFGVFPANTIKEGSELFEAAKKSLQERLSKGGGATGWSNAWIANVFARFGDGEMANEHIKNMFRFSIYPNMLDAHPPFQIDGNFGICSAICEMLLQSQNEEAKFLPAIPKEWKSGSVRGMKMRGGKTVSFSWKDKKVENLVIE